MFVNKKTSIAKKFKDIYGSNSVTEKNKKSRKLKIDLSEDEFNYSAQKERFYLQVNKEQNMRRGKNGNSISDKFALFCMKRHAEDTSDVSGSNNESRGLELSIYSNLADQHNTDTPVYWMPLNDSLLKQEGPINSHGINNSEIILKTEPVSDKQGPLTCPKSKLSNNYFSVEKVPKQQHQPQQNLTSAVFNPQKKTNTRLLMTLNFLKDKLGDERFELIRTHYASRTSDRSFVSDLLKPAEKDMMTIIDYAFNEQSPSTQDSGSMDLEVTGLSYK